MIDRVAPLNSNNGLPNREPELTLSGGGDGADPRLVELVRSLARRAARRWHDQLVQEHRDKRS